MHGVDVTLLPVGLGIVHSNLVAVLIICLVILLREHDLTGRGDISGYRAVSKRPFCHCLIGLLRVVEGLHRRVVSRFVDAILILQRKCGRHTVCGSSVRVVIGKTETVQGMIGDLLFIGQILIVCVADRADILIAEIFFDIVSDGMLSHLLDLLCGKCDGGICPVAGKYIAPRIVHISA